jgi:predicted transcriptional regulator
MSVERRITFIQLRKTSLEDLNSKIQWLGNSLGLFNERDKDKSCYRVFVELLKFPEMAVSSDELAYRLGLSRSAVVHHLNNLIKTGLVVSEKKRYRLRTSNLSALIEEIQLDAERIISDIKRIAREIDEDMIRK